MNLISQTKLDKTNDRFCYVWHTSPHFVFCYFFADQNKMKGLVLYFVLIASVFSQECYFDDALLESSGGSNGGTESAIDINIANTNWKDHRDIIPYYFTWDVPNTDRNTMREAMKGISMKTCIKFKEINYSERHVLKIESNETWRTTCAGGHVGWNTIWKYNDVVLTLFGRNCDIGLMYHELFHVLGVQHTQRRPDRDCYVDINWGCIKEDKKSNFKKLSCAAANTHGTPYMCNSIMHYFAGDFSHDKRYCKSITPKKGLRCKGYMGRLNYPLPEDWDLINRAHCGARTPNNNRCRTCRVEESQKMSETIVNCHSKH